MKNPVKSATGVVAKWFAVILIASPAVVAAPAEPPPAPTPPKSIFIIPSNVREGRDPFYPKSLRPYQSAPAAGNTAHADLTALVMQGVSGPPDHRLAIINNVTFAAGDTAEVRTPQGRIRIHCLQINGDDVLVEVGGQTQELHYRQP